MFTTDGVNPYPSVVRPIVAAQSIPSNGSSAGGMRTLSMTWIIPLLALTSAVVTVASPIFTTPSTTVNEATSPFTISTESPSVTSDEETFPL